MDIKKSNILQHRFKLSSFGLKIYNVNAGIDAGNRRYASFGEFCPQKRKNPLNGQSAGAPNEDIVQNHLT